MNISTVNELITSLESAGELSIKERKYLELAKAYADKEAENVALALTFEKCREVSGCPEGVDLQDYLRQLVSELSVVEDIHNNAVFITDELYDASPKEVQNIIRSLACMKMPAYARLVAGIKADGVEEFLKGSQLPYQIATVLADYDNADDETLHHVIWSGQPPEPDGDVWHLEYVSRGNAIAREVLKQLREGAK